MVGAGGAGFPAYVKAQAQAEFVIANGAECEPLIHKDAVLMKHFSKGIVDGMRLMMQATGAKSGKFGVKTKNADSIEAVKPHLNGPVSSLSDWAISILPETSTSWFIRPPAGSFRLREFPCRSAAL